MKKNKPVKPKKKIHGKMTFSELLDADKDAAMKLAEKGMFCGGCPMAMLETIEQGAKAHGLAPEDLVRELNIPKKKKK